MESSAVVLIHTELPFQVPISKYLPSGVFNKL